MRKVLAILLISLLSLQASWAAAASYCRHEQGAAARHFGHHEHSHHLQQGQPPDQEKMQGKAQDKAQDKAQEKAPSAELAGQGGASAQAHDGADRIDNADSADSTVASLSGADLDCSVCHAHALVGVPSAPALSASDAPVFSAGLLIQPPLPSVPPPRPERPNWLAA